MAATARLHFVGTNRVHRIGTKTNLLPACCSRQDPLCQQVRLRTSLYTLLSDAEEVQRTMNVRIPVEVTYATTMYQIPLPKASKPMHLSHKTYAREAAN